MKKKWLCFLLVLMPFMLSAEEGMWIPVLLQNNIAEMQKMGLKLTAEDIYSVNHSSLKDAIVLFGGGCTGVVVSPEGLLLTNHHCGFGSIQRNSSLEHDYLANGFWAMTKGEELPNPGLTVTFLVRMEEVTDKVMEGAGRDMSESQRGQVLKKNMKKIEDEAIKGTKYEARVRSFYSGNRYFLFVNVIYKDVRLVGAPPSSIGNFGGDTDNWVWPRHTGDFSVFRIYAGKDNMPADYSPDNVPYKPGYYVPVSVKGVRQGDFTMVYGFPGTTREYIPSEAVDLIVNKENPARVAMRQIRLDIMDQAMEKDPLTRIQYASKKAGIANYWKKMIGESRGIHKLNGIEKKQELEKAFQSWSEKDADRKEQYAGILPAYEKIYREYTPYDLASVYLTEGGLGIELVRFAGQFRELCNAAAKKETKPEDWKKLVSKIPGTLKGFYKDYRPEIDRQVAVALLKYMESNMDPAFKPEFFGVIRTKYKGNIDKYVFDLYSETLFTDSTKLSAILHSGSAKKMGKLRDDPVFRVSNDIYTILEKKITPFMQKYGTPIDSLQRLYMSGQMKFQPERRFYPDANSTLRLTYGKVDGYKANDAVEYTYFTTLDGVMQKEDPDISDYRVDKRLKALWEARDFGTYADPDGSMHVAFIATNHTTGGNSGSPVFDGEGRLLGLNFDRTWEGTMSDLMYDKDQCRNITLDIRYCLFIIDRYAGAGHLVREMSIIW